MFESPVQWAVQPSAIHRVRVLWEEPTEFLLGGPWVTGTANLPSSSPSTGLKSPLEQLPEGLNLPVSCCAAQILFHVSKGCWKPASWWFCLSLRSSPCSSPCQSCITTHQMCKWLQRAPLPEHRGSLSRKKWVLLSRCWASVLLHVQIKKLLLLGDGQGGQGTPEFWQWLGWESASSSPLLLIGLARQFSQVKWDVVKPKFSSGSFIWFKMLCYQILLLTSSNF